MVDLHRDELSRRRRSPWARVTIIHVQSRSVGPSYKESVVNSLARCSVCVTEVPVVGERVTIRVTRNACERHVRTLLYPAGRSHSYRAYCRGEVRLVNDRDHRLVPIYVPIGRSLLLREEVRGVDTILGVGV